MNRKYGLSISFLLLLFGSIEVDCVLVVHRETNDLFYLKNAECGKLGAVSHKHFCKCAAGDTLFEIQSGQPCRSIVKESTYAFENILVNANQMVKLTGCHNCNNIIKVSLWNGTLAAKSKPWVDITDRANFNRLYDKFSKHLDLRNLDFNKLKGHLVKIEVNVPSNCAMYKMQVTRNYPLSENVINELFGGSSTTKKTTTRITTTATTTTTTTEAVKTTLISKTTNKVIPTTSSSTFKVSTPKTNSVLKCEKNEALPAWVFALFSIFLIVVLVLFLLVLWLWKERNKVVKDDRIAFCNKTSRMNSAFSLHAMTQDSLNTIPIDSRKSSPRASNISPTSDGKYQDSGYLSPIETFLENPGYGDTYAALNEYPTNVYAESTLAGSKANSGYIEGNLENNAGQVYAELEKEHACLDLKKSCTTDNNANEGLLYAELEKEESYAVLEKEIPVDKTRELLYTPLGEFSENIYVA